MERGFALPAEEFFCQLRKEFSDHLRGIFSNFELVSEDEISHGLANLTAKNSLPTISLDRVYFESKLNLEITRLVDDVCAGVSNAAN